MSNIATDHDSYSIISIDTTRVPHTRPPPVATTAIAPRITATATTTMPTTISPIARAWGDAVCRRIVGGRAVSAATLTTVLQAEVGHPYCHASRFAHLIEEFHIDITEAQPYI